jgi:shikimate dehydrogenase
LKKGKNMSTPKLPSPLNLGLTGFTLGHSLSPALHGAALAYFHLEGSYQLYPVPPLPEGKPGLADLLGRMRQGELHGLNVTIPHKQAVLDLVDELTPTARAIGAVNTVLVRENRLVGDNTDAPGFWAEIQARWGFKTPGHALVLGSGGAARAMVYALAAQQWHVTIAAARPEDMQQAHALAADLAPAGGQLDVILLETAALKPQQDVTLLVNATPLGMLPNVNASAWPEGVSFPRGCKVFDAVYNPPETQLVHQARAAGLQAETGLGMLIGQAAVAFERWTGLAVPIDVMHRSVDQE